MGKSEVVSILLVDDRPENLLALEALLEAPDINLVRAQSGNEALERILEHEFALILLDVQMPEMDGFEIAEIIRSVERTKHIPIIFVTAISKEEQHIFRGYEVGAVDYLFKPLEPVILQSKVRVFLELYRNNSELIKANDVIAEKNRQIELERESLQQAISNITGLIQNVANESDMSIRFPNPCLVKCHEVKHCEADDCRCFGKDAMRCWLISGAYCDSKVQGKFAAKHGDCSMCEVYKAATADPIYHIGEQFNNMMYVLENKNLELEEAYSNLKHSQAQMLQSEKMASIGQLAAGVAHEINNPVGYVTSNLGSLKQYIEILFQYIEAQENAVKGLPDNVVEKLRTLKQQLDLDYVFEDIAGLIRESLEGTERVATIVCNLKTFSRIDEAASTMEDLNLCLDNTLNVVWNELKYKVTLQKDYADLPLTLCNPQQLNQVFVNLFINASHAIEKQGEIIIKTWSESGEIHVSISDTGSGMDEQTMKNIFNPFFTTKEVGKGTGLGLSIAYDIVKKHGGRLSVKSQLGKGTTFIMTIPLLETD